MENDELIEELEIRETVDGQSVDTMPKKRVNRRAPQPANDIEAAIANDAAKNAALAKSKGRPDPYLWGIYIALLVISVIELFSASSSEISGTNVYAPLVRHVVFLLIGFALVLWLQRTPYTLINRLATLFGVVSIALLIISNFFGVVINGAQRAISIGSITIQPPEIAKLAVVCMLASILGKNQTPGGVTNMGVIKSAGVVLAFCALLYKNGMTNTLLIMGVSLSMMLIGGIQWRKMGLVLLVYGLGAGAVYGIRMISPSSQAFDEVAATEMVAGEIQRDANGNVNRTAFSADRRNVHKNRLKDFIRGTHPEDPITDDNRQTMFAKFSQAHGGMFGQGPGNSRESARLPLAFSDYIYSIIVEDTGFVGGAAVLMLYLMLLGRAGRITYRCKRAFPAFLIMGCAVMIVFQALVHMAIVTGVFPVSGQPLPLISKGGTSILVMSMAFGIMMSVSRFASHSGDTKKTRVEKDALPDDMQAANFSA